MKNRKGMNNSEVFTEKANQIGPIQPDEIKKSSRSERKRKCRKGGGEENIEAHNTNDNNRVVEAIKVISFMPIFAASTRKM